MKEDICRSSWVAVPNRLFLSFGMMRHFAIDSLGRYLPHCRSRKNRAGNFDIKPGIDLKDEIALLTDTFNHGKQIKKLYEIGGGSESKNERCLRMTR